MSACQADYSEEDLRLIKSAREETLKEVEKMLDRGSIECMIWGNEWWMNLKQLKSKLKTLNRGKQ